MAGAMLTMKLDYRSYKKLVRVFRGRRKFERRLKAIVRQNSYELFLELTMTSPWDTGEYAYAWQINRVEGIVRNDSPQAMRLEHGYVGIDSLGRHYAQAPQPHIAPAYDKQMEKFSSDISQALKEFVG